MQIKTYKSLEDKQQFLTFCKEQSLLDDNQSSANMWSDDANNHHTLPYILESTNRFDGINGEFFVLFDDDKIAACGGVYLSNFSKQIALAGVRTWVSQDYRHLSLHRDYLLVEHKKWCVERQVKLVALSFNDYNKNIIEIFKRNRLGEKNNRINNREPKHMFYTGIVEVGFPVMIQYTPQWVMYEKLDKNFEFDWNSLK